MARVNVYLPDELAAEARAAGLNVSRLAQVALRLELVQRQGDDWLRRVRRMPSTSVTHEEALAALTAARDDLGG